MRIFTHKKFKPRRSMGIIFWVVAQVWASDSVSCD